MGFEESFLYPLYLILVGGLISGVLIPTFHRIQENRQRKLEIEREERLKSADLEREQRQMTSDRQREDHKHELEIRDKLISNIAKWFSNSLIVIIRASHLHDIEEKEKLSTVINQMCEDVAEFVLLIGLVNLYFKDKQMLSKLTKIFTINQCLLQLATIKEDEKRKELCDTVFDSLNLPKSGKLFEGMILGSSDELNNLLGPLGNFVGTLFEDLKKSEHFSHEKS